MLLAYLRPPFALTLLNQPALPLEGRLLPYSVSRQITSIFCVFDQYPEGHSTWFLKAFLSESGPIAPEDRLLNSTTLN